MRRRSCLRGPSCSSRMPRLPTGAVTCSIASQSVTGTNQPPNDDRRRLTVQPLFRAVPEVVLCDESSSEVSLRSRYGVYLFGSTPRLRCVRTLPSELACSLAQRLARAAAHFFSCLARWQVAPHPPAHPPTTATTYNALCTAGHQVLSVGKKNVLYWTREVCPMLRRAKAEEPTAPTHPPRRPVSRPPRSGSLLCCSFRSLGRPHVPLGSRHAWALGPASRWVIRLWPPSPALLQDPFPPPNLPDIPNHQQPRCASRSPTHTRSPPHSPLGSPR